MIHSMVTLGCILGFAAPPASSSPDLRTQVKRALRHNALHCFAGTVSFTKDLSWTRQYPAGQEGHSQQWWEIITDGRGQIRVKITFEKSKTEHPHFIGETYDQMWMTLGDELIVCDKQAVDKMAELAPSDLSIMQHRAIQARAELDWLLGVGTYAGKPVTLEVLSLDRGPQQRLATVVKMNGKLKTVTFQTVENTLLPLSIASDDEHNTTWRWTYSDYHRVDDYWVPQAVELQGQGRSTSRDLYSQITLVPAPDRDELQSIFEPPTEREGPEFDHILAVMSYTENGMAMTVNGLPVVPRSAEE